MEEISYISVDEIEKVNQVLTDLEASVGIHEHPGSLSDRINELFHVYWGTDKAQLQEIRQLMEEFEIIRDDEIPLKVELQVYLEAVKKQQAYQTGYIQQLLYIVSEGEKFLYDKTHESRALDTRLMDLIKGYQSSIKDCQSYMKRILEALTSLKHICRLVLGQTDWNHSEKNGFFKALLAGINNVRDSLKNDRPWEQDDIPF